MCVSCRNGMSMSGAICAECKCKPATCTGRAVHGKSTIHPARQTRHLSLGTCHSAPVTRHLLLGTGYTDTAHGTLAEPQQTMAESSASHMMHRAWGVGVGVDVSVGPAGRSLGLVECRPSLGLWIGLGLGNTTAPICVLAITIPYIICKPGCAGRVRWSCRCFISSPTV